MPDVVMCHCGKPLHYTDKKLEYAMNAITRDLGEYIPVTADGRTWLVQRHYVALHGLKSVELPFLGFNELTGQGAA